MKTKINFHTLKSNIIILIARCRNEEDMVLAFEEIARQLKDMADKMEREK